MNIFVRFWDMLVKSIFSPSYYNEIIRTKFSASVGFFVIFFILWSALVSIMLMGTTLSPLRTFLQILPEELANVYPEELVIRIADGEVSTNVEEPYRIPLSAFDGMKENLERYVGEVSEGDVESFLVIDTQARAQDIHEYMTVFLLTNSHLVALDNAGFEAVSLRGVDYVIVTKEVVEDFLEGFAPFTGYVWWIFGFFVFIVIVLFFLSWNAVYIALFALALLLISKIANVSLTYKQGYQMGLHLIVVPTLVVYTFRQVLDTQPPFAFTAVMILWLLVVLSEMKNKS